MKLMLCTKCMDVFKLTRSTRTCACGTVVGKYDEDGHHAVTNGKGKCLAIGNGSLLHSMWYGEPHPAINSDKYANYNKVLCWTRPHEGPKNPRSRVDPDLAKEVP